MDTSNDLKLTTFGPLVPKPIHFSREVTCNLCSNKWIVNVDNINIKRKNDMGIRNLKMAIATQLNSIYSNKILLTSDTQGKKKNCKVPIFN